MSELIKFQLADNSKAMDGSKGNAVSLEPKQLLNNKKKKTEEEGDSDDDELLGDDADFVFMQEYRSKRLEGIAEFVIERVVLVVIHDFVTFQK